LNKNSILSDSIFPGSMKLFKKRLEQTQCVDVDGNFMINQIDAGQWFRPNAE
jgi:hypothetical protein